MFVNNINSQIDKVIGLHLREIYIIINNGSDKTMTSICYKLFQSLVVTDILRAVLSCTSYNIIVL